MDNFQKFAKNLDAVSEVIGPTLMSVLVLIIVSSIASFVCSNQGLNHLPRADLEGWADPYSDTLYLKHVGGDIIYAEDLELFFCIKGEKYVLSSSEISDYLGGDSWIIGDTITVNTRNKWGVPIDTADYIEVFLVSSESDSVIRKIEMPLEYVGFLPEMELNKWYFFTTVDGNDSADMNLEYMKDYDLNADLSSDSLITDKYLGEDNIAYTARNSFFHILKDDPLDLRFGFRDGNFKGFEVPPQNITIRMVYRMKQEPNNLVMDVAESVLPAINPQNNGEKKWYLYNRTVEMNINKISELKFNLHVNADGSYKEAYIDYLAVRFS